MARMAMRVFIVPLCLASAKFLNSVSSISFDSSQRNHINFNQDIFRKPGYFDDGASRRLLLEVAAGGFVVWGECSHGFEEDGSAQNVFEEALSGAPSAREI